VSGVGAAPATGGTDGADTGGTDFGGAGSGGADSGGADSGGSDTGGGDSGGSGGTPSVLTVNTANDEENVGATPADPGGGGFSLREAILYANELPDHQQIVFQSAYSIPLSSPLPTITETVEILGSSTSILGAGAGSSGPCIAVDASDVTLDTLWIFDCQAAPVAFLSGSGNLLARSYISGGAEPATFDGTGPVILFNYWAGSDGAAIEVLAADAEVLANQIVDAAGAGIVLTDTADDAYLLANAIIGANPGVDLGALDGARLWHNTIVDGPSSGVRLTGTTNVDFRNNIVSGASAFGVEGSDAQFTFLDYNLYFDNGSGDCSSCSPGASDLTGDPLFVNPGGDDYALEAGSPAVDSGVDLGDDRNVTGPGLYNGTAPDRGFIERE